ncbi:MAG: ATP-binding cassette domain-containing protein [Acidobacteriaceae bacterium]
MNALEMRIEFKKGFPLSAEFVIAGGTTVLFGSSGAGKTTVLDAIAGIRQPARGRIVIEQEVVFDSQQNIRIPPERRRIGYVAQALGLFPHMSAFDNAAFGVPPGTNREQRKSSANEWLRRFGVVHLAERRPGDWSGGERQRVAIARALASAPRLLLLDEPFSALDEQTKFGIILDLKKWLREAGLPVLFVTHDVAEAFALGDRLIEIDRGKIMREGGITEILGERRDDMVRRLLART